jgi:hypothetical protein
MNKRTLIVTGQLARQAIKRTADEVPEGWAVTFAEQTRTQQQNALLHPLLTDISRQALWMGKKRPMLQWKTIMVSAHAIATGQPAEMVIGIEGEVVNLRESTAAMSVKRFASLTEYVLAWGAMNGVTFSTPAEKPAHCGRTVQVSHV